MRQEQIVNEDFMKRRLSSDIKRQNKNMIICGPRVSGKTKVVRNEIKQLLSLGKNVIVFTPVISYHTYDEYIEFKEISNFKEYQSFNEFAENIYGRESILKDVREKDIAEPLYIYVEDIENFSTKDIETVENLASMCCTYNLIITVVCNNMSLFKNESLSLGNFDTLINLQREYTYQVNKPNEPDSVETTVKVPDKMTKVFAYIAEAYCCIFINSFRMVTSFFILLGIFTFTMKPLRETFDSNVVYIYVFALLITLISKALQILSSDFPYKIKCLKYLFISCLISLSFTNLNIEHYDFLFEILAAAIVCYFVLKKILRSYCQVDTIFKEKIVYCKSAIGHAKEEVCK